MAERWVANASPVTLRAKERGFLIRAKPALEKLRGAGAWVSEELIDRAIALAGEA